MGIFYCIAIKNATENTPPAVYRREQKTPALRQGSFAVCVVCVLGGRLLRGVAPLLDCILQHFYGQIMTAL